MSKFNGSLSLLAWAFNEEENVDSFISMSVRHLEAVCDDWEIVLVDDGSTDRTAELIDLHCAQDSRIRLIRHPENLNVGRAIPTAIRAASKQYLFWNTFDNSYDTKELAQRVQHLNEYDIVQCVRLRGQSDTFIKYIISRANYLLLRLLSGVNLTDFQNCTFHRTQDVQRVVIQSNSALTNPELIIKRYYAGARIKEVPIDFAPRQKGEAKGSKFPFLLKSIANVCWWAPIWRLQHLRRRNWGSIDSARRSR